MHLKLTHLDKVFWPKLGYTKGDVINYYETLAPLIVPYLKNRPFVMNRYPNGIDHESFFQKQVNLDQLPPGLKTIAVSHQERIVDYLAINTTNALLYAANLGCIELNPFHARTPHLDRPDYMVIDLDPEDLAINYVIQVALVIHEILDSMSLKNFCKTSGKRGLHIFVPLNSKATFEQSRELAKQVGILAQKKLPKLISLEHKPSARQQKVYIDYLRNARHQTIASAYSLRPVAYAPVSAPLSWDEVKPGLNPLDFTIETMPQRIYEKGDLFAGVLK